MSEKRLYKFNVNCDVTVSAAAINSIQLVDDIINTLH